MKVAFIPSTFLPYVGGAETQTHNIANSLEKKNVKVDIYLLNGLKINNAKYKIKTLNKYLINFVFLLRYYFNINLNFLLKNYFKKLCFKNNYDIWHFHSVNYKTLIYINILSELDQKIIVTLQGADIQIDRQINYGYRLDPKYEQFLRYTFKKVHFFHAISKNIMQELIKIGVNKGKILIIPNCSPYDKIKKIQKIKSRKKLTLLTIGRYAIKKKGFDLVEKITKKLNLISNFEWIIIGRNTTELYKNKFIIKNKKRFKIIEEIKNHDELYFPHTKLINYYKRSDVYVNLSRVEGCPIVLLDALSSNLPIVSFNTRGGDEIVIDKINGFLVKNSEIKNFVNKILKTKKMKIKKNSYKIKKIIKKYDLFENTKKIISNYSLLK